ncbi:hypothetical protein CS022_12715 [Veronia nyctiphanis]|uniref:Flagellar hook-length control protein FliK n=1 Tax=Veronia nyctiphanis TaxID=1278244 RepID=A0A4V1LSU7_9GAMM|nr:hypothetical protein [Veronia nyctiphanis]RXJ72938.1 hypothetical protein CS022_12715 [Veronia nyctiphanis]
MIVGKTPQLQSNGIAVGKAIQELNNVNQLKQILLEATLSPTKNSNPQSLQVSTSLPRIISLLQNLNLYPALTKQSSQAPSNVSQLFQALLSQLTLPMPSENAPIKNWLKQRPADSTLSSMLSLLADTNLVNEDSPASQLKSLLMLSAEKRVAEQPRDGQFHWLIPHADPEKTPVEVNVSRRAKGDNDEDGTDGIEIRITLPLESGERVIALASLEQQSLRLHFTTSTEKVERKIQTSLPLLEHVFASHNIALSGCQVSRHTESDMSASEQTPSSGLSIKV